MKKIFVAILWAAMLCTGCTQRIVGPERPQTGDLLFVGIPFNYGEDGMASAIAASTGGEEINFIHTAIIEVDSATDSVWIVDATLKHGVDRYPLAEFLRDFTMPDGSYPHFEVMRLKDNSRAAEFVQNAKAFIGEEYDKYFIHDNGKHYCTELVYDSYVTDAGHVFGTVAMNFKDSEGNMPAYWTNLFESIGAEVPQGHPGTNPQQMHQSPALQSTGVDIVSLIK